MARKLIVALLLLNIVQGIDIHQHQHEKDDVWGDSLAGVDTSEYA